MALISINSTVADFNLSNQNSGTKQVNYADPTVNAWFPYDLGQGGNNKAFIMFQFYKYDRPSIYSPPNLNSLGNVILPMPSDLVDRVSLSYSQQDSTSAVGAAIDSITAAAAQKNGIAGTLQMLAQHSTTVSEGAGLSGLEGAAALVGGSGALAKGLQIFGLAQNPFLSILFNAPNFKKFGMTWTFIPETPEDSATIDFIVNKFKYHSLPDIAGGGLFFSYPDMMVPVVFPQNYFFNFKQCVLESVVVNYVPGNTPAIYSGTLAPSALQFTIEFLEVGLWVKSDIIAQSSPSGASGTQPTPTGVVQPSRPVTPTPGSAYGVPSSPSNPTTPDPLGSSLTITPPAQVPADFYQPQTYPQTNPSIKTFQ